MNEDRISIRDALVRAAVPLAALAAMAALALYEVDSVGRAETVYLAGLATAGLLAVAFLVPPPAWEVGVGSTLAVTTVWALPSGPGRGAAVVLLLAAALAVAAGRSKDIKDPKGERPSPRWSVLSFESFRSLRSFLPLALGLQVLLRGGELLFQPQLSPRTLVALLALPAAGAAATAVLARRHGPAALIAAGAALLLAPGWNVAATAGLVALAAGDLIARWRGAIPATVLAGALLLMREAPDPSMAAGPLALAVLYLGRKVLAVPAAAVAILLFVTTLLASYPWLRDEPLQDALELLVQIPTPGDPLLPAATAVVVDAAHPAWRWQIGGKRVATVVVDSSLSNGTGLVNGTLVATLRLRGRDGRTSEHVLRAGEDTGEWAARRADVAAGSVLRSPPAWISWVAGDFFGQRYRSLWTVETPGPGTELSVERNPALPPQVSLALHGVEIRP